MQSLEMPFIFDIDVFTDIGVNHVSLVGLFDVRIKQKPKKKRDFTLWSVTLVSEAIFGGGVY